MNHPARYPINIARHRLIAALRDHEHPCIIEMWRDQFRARLADTPVPPRGTAEDRERRQRAARNLERHLR